MKNQQLKNFTKPLLVFCFILNSVSTMANRELPITDFFKTPDFSSLQISPDGKHMAAVVVRGQEKVVVVMNIEDPLQVKLLNSFTPPKYEYASSVFWVNNERVVFSTEEKQTGLTSPRSTNKLFAGNIDGSKRKQIAGRNSRSKNRWIAVAGLIDMAEHDPKRIMVNSFGLSDGRLKAVWLDTYTGKTDVVESNPLRGFGSFISDHDQQLRFVVGNAVDEDKQVIMYRDNNKEKWLDFEHPFSGDVSIRGFDANNTTAYIVTEDSAQFGLYAYDTTTKKYQQLLTDEVSAIDDVMWSRNGETLLAARFHVGGPKYKYLNPNHPTAVLQQQLAQAFPGAQVRITSVSENQQRATVFVSSDTNPGMNYIWEEEAKRLTPISPRLPHLDQNMMAKQQPFTLKARDGLDLHGYLTLPPHKQNQNLPMVVVIHGGPHGIYDRWGWSPESQLLANRGYLVLQVNYRGSGGYGEAFEQAGYKKWGTAMQDDVTDATKWAIEQGYADPNRVCIYGGSYGGYATLAGIVREPDLYRCAFAFAGVYDLELMFNTGDIGRSESGKDFLRKVLGEDVNDMKERSPINHVSKIKTPLYIAHGIKDDRADVKHFYALRDALDEAEIPYKQLLTSKEAHGFYDLSNREELYGRMLNFVKAHIGQ